MGKRLFDDDSGWTVEAHHTYDRILAAIVPLFEESDADVRDFHFIAVSVVSDIVATYSIRKRLEKKNETE